MDNGKEGGSKMIYDYDILFLGGGLNYAGAVTAAKAGLRTALVEKKMAHLGGTCLHNGCIPSKMYLHAAETVRTSKKSHFTGEIGLDMARLDAEKEAMLSMVTGAITKQCRDVELIDGEGILTASYTVTVGDRTMTAKHIVIGTGSTPFVPEGIVYDGEGVIGSDDVLNMQVLPEKIAVYGTGAIAGKRRSELEDAGVVYHESSVPLGGLPYPHINDADLGMMAVYSDEENFIIGAEIFAPHAEELIAVVAMAIAGELDVTLAKRTILAHPTCSESPEKSFMRLEGAS